MHVAGVAFVSTPQRGPDNGDMFELLMFARLLMVYVKPVFCAAIRTALYVVIYSMVEK